MNIAFCKFAGMGNGGCEKYLQSIALLYKQRGHSVNYFYTNAAPSIGSSFVHPDNNADRIALLESKDIILTKIDVGSRSVSLKEFNWIDTNFPNLFHEKDYEYMVTAGDGRAEYPYTDLHDIKIIHTVHGSHPFNKPNIVKSVLLCRWQAEQWIANGGNRDRVEIIPPIVVVPEVWTKNFRVRHGIPVDAFVYGLHQGKSDAGSLVSLQAFASLRLKNSYCVFLGGSDNHRQFCIDNNLANVIFLDVTSCVNSIHEFLDSIDVYAHCRVDGEVASACIIEAMFHKKPIISFIGNGINLGHLEQLEGCGRVCHSVEEYAEEMVRLQDKNYHAEMSHRIGEKYNTFYDYKLVEKKLLQLIGTV